MEVREPHVLLYRAEPSEVYSGETTTLSWRVAEAERVILFGPDGPLLNAPVVEGSIESGALGVSSTFVLRASTQDGLAVERSLDVTVHEGARAEISRFSVHPRWLTRASTVAVEWIVLGAVETTLALNGASVDDLPSVIDGRMVLDAAPGDELRLHVRGPYDETEETIVLSTATPEVEPNDTEAAALALEAPVLGRSSFGDLDVYALVVEDGGSVQIEARDVDDGCAFDLGLELLTSSGTSLGYSDALDDCPRIDPEHDAFARDLLAGTHFVRVRSFGSSHYVVMGGAEAPSCGNGWTETRAGETCDFAREPSCSAECQIEGTVEVEPNDDPVTSMPLELPAVVLAAVESPSSVDSFRFAIPAGHVLEAAVFTDGLSGCRNGEVFMVRLYADGGEFEQSFSGSSSIDPACVRLVTNVDERLTADRSSEFTLLIQGESPGAYFLEVESKPLGCGDGVLDSEEECEPATSALGVCDASCHFVTAGVISGDQVVTGTLAPGRSVVYELATTSTAHLSVESYSPAAPNCDSANSLLTLYGPLGVMVRDDFSGSGRCARIDPRLHAGARSMAPGRYFVMLTAQSELPSYSLVLRLTEPTCSDAIVDEDEECDDGNGVAGDGCDEACRLDAIEDVTTPYDGQFRLSGFAATKNFRFGPQTAFDVLSGRTTTPGGSCPYPGVVRIKAPSGEIFYTSFQGCLRDFSRGRRNRQLLPESGEYVLSLRSHSLVEGDFFLALEPRPNVCGDGHFRPSEACDDGNTESGDGCSSSCGLERTAHAEREPNDVNAELLLRTTTEVPYTSTTAAGRIAPADVDRYELVAQVPFTLRARTYGAQGAADLMDSCAGDTTLSLFDGEGELVTSNDDDRTLRSTACSTLDERMETRLAGLPAGSYVLEVRGAGLSTSVPFYLLDVELRP